MWLELRSSSGVFLGASRGARIGGCVVTEDSVKADAGLVLSRLGFVAWRSRPHRGCGLTLRDIATLDPKRKAALLFYAQGPWQHLVNPLSTSALTIMGRGFAAGANLRDFQDPRMLRRVMGAVSRNRGRAIAAVTVLVGLAAFAVGHAATETASLIKVRMGGDGPETRLVLELDGSATAKVVADGAADRRIVILLPDVTGAQTQQGAGRGVVRAWTIDQTSAGARLQIDLAASAVVKRRFLLPPGDGITSYRYVIDVAAAPVVNFTSVKTAAAMTAAPTLRAQFLPARKAAAPAAPLKALPALPLKKVVVIDAGHGGKDPGSLGANGYEKDINLAAALTLADQLGKTGRYKVVLTRSTDVYIPLEDRVRVAQRAGADLFISLHSDSGPEADLKGASVYTLSDKGTARSARFMARDNWLMKASLSGDQGVRDILFDLTQRATRNRSGVFAQTLVSSIDGQAPMLRHSHRDAGFMVLLAPDVPAVLLEMGFVSNPADEARLRDPAARARFMSAVGRAIDTHFGETFRIASR